MTTTSMARRRVSLDPADRWTGRYLGPHHLSLYPLPTVVPPAHDATTRTGPQRRAA
jgi:hypothetical protein